MIEQPTLSMRRVKDTPKPFLKWAGGKRSLLDQYQPHFERIGSYRRYIEPFVGSGAVFFWLQPAPSLLFDSNADLIEVYEIVRDDLPALMAALSPHHNDKDHYYAIRSQDPTTLTKPQRAARFIFLNRTCYNGLYRVNRNGQFNVPFGAYKNPTICDAPTLRAANAALQGVTLGIGDFSAALGEAGAGDVVYFDPPYAPLSKTSNFTGYTGAGFGDADQQRLAATFADLHGRGCKLLLSNSDAPLIRELYADFNIHEILARRAINSKTDGRGAITELLITNY